MKNKIYFAKTKEGAKIPTKRKEDGCYDLYACFNTYQFTIPPRTVKLVPTGIASAFSPKYRIAFRERGSNTKSGLIVMAGQIDSGYRGEYFVALYNPNDIPVEITKGVYEVEKTKDFVRVPYSKAICQFAVERVPNIKMKELPYMDLLSIKSERGLGRLGSTNK